MQISREQRARGGALGASLSLTRARTQSRFEGLARRRRRQSVPQQVKQQHAEKNTCNKGERKKTLISAAFALLIEQTKNSSFSHFVAKGLNILLSYFVFFALNYHLHEMVCQQLKFFLA
jgi:4-alpha-glucanotransferase